MAKARSCFPDVASVTRMRPIDSFQQWSNVSKRLTWQLAVIRLSLQSLVMCDILPPIKSIDEGELDDYVLINGKWTEREESQ